MCANVWRFYRCGHGRSVGFSPCARAFDLKEQYDMLMESLLPKDALEMLPEGSSCEYPINLDDDDDDIFSEAQGDMGPFLCAAVGLSFSNEAMEDPELDFHIEDSEKADALCDTCEKSIKDAGFTKFSFQQAGSQREFLEGNGRGHTNSPLASISASQAPQTTEAPLRASSVPRSVPMLSSTGISGSKSLKQGAKQPRGISKAKQRPRPLSKTQTLIQRLNRSYGDIIDHLGTYATPNSGYNDSNIARQDSSAQKTSEHLADQISRLNIDEGAPNFDFSASLNVSIQETSEFRCSHASRAGQEPYNTIVDAMEVDTDATVMNEPDISAEYDMSIYEKSTFAENQLKLDLRDCFAYGIPTARSLALAQQEAEQSILIHNITQSIKDGYIAYEQGSGGRNAAEEEAGCDDSFAKVLEEFDALGVNSERLFDS